MFKAATRILILFIAMIVFYTFVQRLSKSARPISKIIKFVKHKELSKEDDLGPLVDEVTIVTAYFDIGSFQKGNVGAWGAETYQRWMTVFKLLENPLIVFVDNHRDWVKFKEIRTNSSSNRTLIIKLRKSKMWSFLMIPRIAQIYNQTGYPKHPPNTIVPGYSSAMHAKYETLQLAIGANSFRSKYFCWLDVGLFRHLAPPPNSGGTPFSLYLPPNHIDDAVSVNQLNPRNEKLTPKEIIYGNIVWVGGGFFIARHDVMLNWTKEYHQAAENLLSSNLMSTDQQVVYSAYNNATHPPLTKFKIYLGSDRTFTGDEWFHLAYVARDAGAKRKLTTTPAIPTTSVNSTY